jgi:hypothetical protein
VNQHFCSPRCVMQSGRASLPRQIARRLDRHQAGEPEMKGDRGNKSAAIAINADKLR